MPETKQEKIEKVKANLPRRSAGNPGLAIRRCPNHKAWGLAAYPAMCLMVRARPLVCASATKSSASVDMSGIGRQGTDGLKSPPRDAVAK
jgi:hypothetical protein